MARRDRYSLAEWFEMAHKAEYRAHKLSKVLNVCPRQLHRYTQEAFGQSPQAWLADQRLKIAVGMLRKLRSVKAVSLTMGFKQVSHFSREFKLYYGVSPAEFIRWSEIQNVRGR